LIHPKTLVSINGKVETSETANISAFDRGFLFGHAVFETLLAIQNGLVFWKEHFNRLKKNCAFSKIQCPSEEALKKDCAALIEQSMANVNYSNTRQLFSIKILVSGGCAQTLKILREETQLPTSNIVIYCTPATQNESLKQTGLKVLAFPDARGQNLVKIKSNNYLWNTLALDEAIINKYDDALLTGSKLELLECTTANFVWVNYKNEWKTTPSEGYCLPGTTLIALRGALAKHNFSFSEELIYLSELDKIKNCYAISSVRGLVPISLINTYQFEIEAEDYTKVNLEIFKIQEKSANL
jgi:branched-subunit amino acid aminotransferase/4-amino-4-deoxychorismate lyase